MNSVYSSYTTPRWEQLKIISRMESFTPYRFTVQYLVLQCNSMQYNRLGKGAC